MKNRGSEEASPQPGTSYWFARHSKSVIFLILTLALLGGYLAFTIPDRRLSCHQLPTDPDRGG